ncbi:MAG: hypothetical protein KIT31_07600 [Deltaproteobacteria bacterium]|nr:hypothetical protein [Deltaproteobacteria bacterium]
MRTAWIVLGTSLLGCGGGGGGGGGGNCPAFATIVDGRFARTGTTLTWTLEVEELPPELPFDRDGIPSFVLEYGWTVEIDADGDGTEDLEVSAMHFKTDAPPRTAPPLSVLQVNLWTVDGAVSSITGSADATIAGNTFTFTVEESEDPALAGVTAPSQSVYATFHQVGPSITDQCRDRYSPP